MCKFTREDFLETTKPYEFLYEMKKDPVVHEQALIDIQENARAVGIRNFRKLYKSYEASLRLLDSHHHPYTPS